MDCLGGGGTESRVAELGQIRFHDFCARKNPPSCPAGRTGLASRNVFFLLHVQPAGINFIGRKFLPEMRSRGDVGGRSRRRGRVWGNLYACDRWGEVQQKFHRLAARNPICSSARAVYPPPGLMAALL